MNIDLSPQRAQSAAAIFGLWYGKALPQRRRTRMTWRFIFHRNPSAFICVHLRLIFVSLSDRIQEIQFKLFLIICQKIIESANDYQPHSCLNLLKNKPQINADERRFVNLNIQRFSEVYPSNGMINSPKSSAIPVPTFEAVAASRIITQITRIFTYPCALMSSVRSVFHNGGVK